MQQKEKDYCNAMINAVIAAAKALGGLSIEDALRRPSFGKGDTLSIDAIPEIIIIEGLQGYDDEFVIITEETGGIGKVNLLSVDEKGRPARTVFVIDPTDRSSQLEEAFGDIKDKKQTVFSAMKDPQFKKNWVKKFSGPISITGGCTAITCIRRGVPFASVIINYITREIIVGCPAGCRIYQLKGLGHQVDLNEILKKGKKIFFNGISDIDASLRFITFMGKSGYKENFMGINYMDEDNLKKNLDYDLPGGPTRALYLSSLQTANHQIGFIMSNGEKLTEWCHWLPFLIYGRNENDQDEPALCLYEICSDLVYVKEGIYMATPLEYSIFKEIAGLEIINIGLLQPFRNPTHYRSTLILAHANNHVVKNFVKQYDFREIKFPQR